MNSRRFHQPGMKKCQARKEEMQVLIDVGSSRETVIFAME